MSEINLANVLELKRPLAVLDLETTGLSPERDRICQIAVTIHYPDKGPVPWVSLINPMCEIHSEVAAIHGITNETVQDEPRFSEIGPRLYPHLEGADIMGYNVKFDIAFLAAEMKRAGVHWSWDGYIVDPLQIYRKHQPHSLERAYLEYGGGGGKSLHDTETRLEDAHDAGADVAATEAVLRGLVARYDVPQTVEELAEYCFPTPKDAIDRPDGSMNWKPKFAWKGGEPCINFGKHAGLPIKDVPHDYWNWMLNKDSFSESCKDVVRDALKGVYPRKD